MQGACAELYCHLWHVWLYHIFPHYLIHGRIFGKQVTEYRMCVPIFSTTPSEIFLILRRAERDIIINVHTSSKAPFMLVRF